MQGPNGAGPITGTGPNGKVGLCPNGMGRIGRLPFTLQGSYCTKDFMGRLIQMSGFDN